MLLQKGISLAQYSTFHVPCIAEHFAVFENIEQVHELIESKFITEETLVLGGGSNVLFVSTSLPSVVRNDINFIEIIEETENNVVVKCASGETWHGVVEWAVERNLGGIENLALIPGTIGAAPIQNIGAYGTELKDVLQSVTFIDRVSNTQSTLTKQECNFGYRDSIFKNELKNKVVITEVVLQLAKNPTVNIEYADVTKELAAWNVLTPSIKDVFNAVVAIRSRKLPNPNAIGNAGSFFKNPVITKEHFNSINSKHANLPFYIVDENNLKIPAGYLIEQCGWKGYRDGDAGCYDKQALVLVNYQHATGEQILNLAKRIQQSVLDTYDINLEMEVSIL